MPDSTSCRAGWVLCLSLVVAVCGLFLDRRATLVASAEDNPASAPAKKGPPPAGADDLVPLNPGGTVLLDSKRKRVLLKTHVVLREGALELFCCLKQTKEHESILSLDARAYVVHTALLALGAKPGAPARFGPEPKPPTGQRIDIFVNWTDEKGKEHRVPARSWVRHLTRRFWAVPLEKLPEGVAIPRESELRFDRKLKELSWYGPMSKDQKETFYALTSDAAFRKAIDTFYEQSQPKEMRADWVFAGSGFYKDEEKKKEYYLAEDGDLICVANFGSAMIDVSVESSSQGESLLYEAWTERIPPRETPVTLELIPLADKAPQKAGAKGPAAGKPSP